MSVLSARGLWVAAPGARECVVRDFSLELGRGEWLAIAGANGSGKTTLALALAGLWPIARGTLELEGRAFGPHGAPGQRARVAVLLQDPASQLLQGTLRDELAFAARNLDRPEAQVLAAVEEWSARLGLGMEPDGDPRTLSAGGQQLALIGAALIAGPGLLIADEPASHLDPRARAVVLRAVRAEVERGLSVAWVTQDPLEIAAADRLVTLGEVVAGLEAPPAPDAPHGDAFLRLRVGVPCGTSGPLIRVRSPVEITLHRRGVTALKGPNGVGKSVLLAAAAGALELEQVEIERFAAADHPPIIATQYPEHQIFEERVGDELVWAAVSRGLARPQAERRADACLRELGLDADAMASRRTWELSGGEKRLIEVVAALIAPASLLALDEPTAGLDPARRRALARLVTDRATGGPILIASQDAGWIEVLGSRTVTLGA